MQSKSKNMQLFAPSQQAIEIQRMEIDQQIATANQFKRKIPEFKENALAMIRSDRDLAEGCSYALTRKTKDGKKKIIEGPSIRLAEIALATYKNIRCAARINGYDDKWVCVHAFAHDLEANTRIDVEIKRRITDKRGHTYSDDMIQTTGAAAISIAIRNAIFKVIPFSLVNSLRAEAAKVAIGKGKEKKKTEDRWLEHFEKRYGVTNDQIFEKFQVLDKTEMSLDDWRTLAGIKQAIDEGTTSVIDEFPIQEPESIDGKDAEEN